MIHAIITAAVAMMLIVAFPVWLWTHLAAKAEDKKRKQAQTLRESGA